MNDLRRVLLWSVFAVSLMMLWDGWLRHTGQPSLFAPPAQVDAASAASSGAAARADASVPQGSSVAGAGAVTAVSASASDAASAPKGELLALHTDLMDVTIDTLGGSVVKAVLLKHRDQEDTQKHVVILDHTATHTYEAQTGLIGAANQALPNHKTLFTAQTAERSLADGSNVLVLSLASIPVDGVQLVKTYTFTRGSYAIGVKQEVVNGSAQALRPTLYVQIERDGTPPAAAPGPAFVGGPQSYTGMAIYSAKGKYQKIDFAHLDENKAEFEKTDNNGWVAMVQHHFVSAWLDNSTQTREFFARKVDTNLYTTGMLIPVGDVAAGQRKAVASVLYVGPQEEDKLSVLAPGLELVKDYGWTTILAKPLYWLLNKLHGLLSNWGWAIIALVVLLKAAFYWLNASAYRSMGKMKALNPRIQALRETMKDEPQKLQAEMLKIYREEKVNPIGGCLPILIQIPVFIALYSVLSSSVEIRNAPWIGWITDLSVKDPYFVLPALMTLSSLLQTWLNPTPPDPIQAKMMWIMPLLFSVMFFFFPAGLVLYWLTNNVLSIAQQWMINKQLGVTN
jgi:YidC/Oxa1 family membrane protein insertase